MSENNGMISKSEVGGSVSYSEDVIAIISGLAATEIHGVAGMSGGLGKTVGEGLEQEGGIVVSVPTQELYATLYLVSGGDGE